MNDIFDAPTAENFQNDRLIPLRIDYSAGKTPAQYVDYNTPEKLGQLVSEAKLGFSYYDKEKQQKYLVDKFTFAVLEVYSKITGKDGQGYMYWSNPVKDSRTEQFRVMMSGIERPIETGLYSQIKERLPQGVGFHLHFLAFCVELDKVVEIKMSATLQRGIERAMIASAAKVGKKIKPAEKGKPGGINFFTLAENDVLNGYSFTGDYTMLDIDGNEWKAGKDAYYSPNFHHGIINPTGKNVELHSRCVDLQNRIRTQYADSKAKYSGGITDTPNIPDFPKIPDGASLNDQAPTTAAQYDPLFPISNEAKPASNAAQIAIPTGLEDDDLPF